MFGLVNNNDDNIMHIFNFCILFAKFYIYYCKVNSKHITLDSYKKLLKNRVQVEIVLTPIDIDNNNTLDWKKLVSE